MGKVAVFLLILLIAMSAKAFKGGNGKGGKGGAPQHCMVAQGQCQTDNGGACCLDGYTDDICPSSLKCCRNFGSPGPVIQDTTCTDIGGRCVNMTNGCCPNNDKIDNKCLSGGNDIKCCRSVIAGIDVSHYQDTINWNEVPKSGASFAIMKATERGTFKDKNFTYNWEGANAQGMRVGAYHYFTDTHTVANQVNNFLSSLTAQQSPAFDFQNDWVVIDIESAGTGVSNDARTDLLYDMLVAIEIQSGAKPIIYTYGSFWNTNINSARHDFTPYKLWIAHYTSALQPNKPSIFPNWYIWQYTDSGTADGITGNVDWNRMETP